MGKCDNIGHVIDVGESTCECGATYRDSVAPVDARTAVRVSEIERVATTDAIRRATAISTLTAERDRLQEDRDYLAKKAEDCTRRHCLREPVEQLTDEQLYAEFSRRKLEPCHGQVLADASDQQLREECVERGWRSAVTEQTDEQLRAECERRRIAGTPTWEQMRQLNAELADVRALCAEARNQRNEAQVAAEAFAGARDSWMKAMGEVDEAIKPHIGTEEVAHRADWLRKKLERLAFLERMATGAPIVVNTSSKMKADSIEVGGVVFRAIRPSSMSEEERLRGERRGSDYIREAGPSIAELDLPSPKHDAIDLATLADLLADDA